VAASALLAEQPVYLLTRDTLNDLVRAVLVLLALSVPFAFAAERLLIGAVNVYRQIGWFAGFFTLTFLVLFFTHPAFAISQTPTIIFLGFAVVVLAALVIVIIMRRFEVELKILQGLTSTVHAADVSRFSTVMAAMAMGISTMRRRPLRTALTAITIVMLTFTILCFASFGTQTGIVKLFVGATPGYTGAFVHRVSWTELSLDILDVLGPRWGHHAEACCRFWISPKTPQNQGPLITRADGTRPLALRGVLGLDAREFAHRPDLAALFGANADRWADVVLVTRAVAERLGVKPGDPVLVGGRLLHVGTLLDPSQVSAAKDMDGNGILPVDFVEMKTALSETVSGEASLAAQGEQNWAYLPTDSVAVVSAANAHLMGAALHAVTLYTPDTRSATDLAEAVAKTLPLPVSATRSEGVYRHVLGTLVEASGAGDLVFPILLGGLVIFGTMLGSVADREKEIYTFSSLGLAPPHVASLFLAEAMVYSVIGGMAGYLLAQGANKVLAWLAGYGLVRVPEMNYSSANAIATILIVMGTVLVSAIYPAVKASRSANPGILRTWRVPAPKGDVLDLEFPFTVSEYDITGVVSFLKEHFDNFGDTGLGRFMARNARLVRGEGRQLGLDADLALAPFDLGVTQAFELRSAPSEIPGIDLVAIRITRKSGQPKDWRRLNKVLLDDLRRQFLIWRALPHHTMELYRQRTLTLTE
ncbi:MAG TPA: ABC transporter permease, partial [Planctomycetota bacterium]|nr:ABC transporter permease [Planctomycetota bacterium]